MTTFFLIRHGSNDYFTHTLVGRKPGIHLNETGRREAEKIAERLKTQGVQFIFSSPMERCLETAEPLASSVGVKVQIAKELLEVDFGDWTGKSFAELDQMESWKQWNAFRTGTRASNGETMIEVQARMVGIILKLKRQHPEGRIALFSHGDPLRAALLYFLGAPLEFVRRIELSPGSVSILELTNWDAKVTGMNLL